MNMFYYIHIQAQGAVGGLWIGLGMLAWYPDPYRFGHKGTVVKKALDAPYIFSKVKGPMMWSTAACGVFSITECLVEQMRDESHHKTYHNAAAGGAAAGLVMGSMTKRIDIMAASALMIGLTMGMVEYNGKTYVADPTNTARKWTPFARSDEEEETKTLKNLKEKYASRSTPRCLPA
jgi:hypothetical protein